MILKGPGGKEKSVPSVFGYLAPRHAPLIPALLAPSPSAPAPAGAHSCPPGHPRAPARSPHVLRRAPSSGPRHALSACSPPRRGTRAGSSRASVPVRHVVPTWRQPPGGFPPPVDQIPPRSRRVSQPMNRWDPTSWTIRVLSISLPLSAAISAAEANPLRHAPKGQDVTPDRAPPSPLRSAARVSPCLYAKRPLGRFRVPHYHPRPDAASPRVTLH